MYPAEELLQEIGRVTIAGARLELLMGALWHHLNPEELTLVEARRQRISQQVKGVSKLARSRLYGALGARVQAAAEHAKTAAEHRNEIVHQDWVLRGPDSMRPAGDLVGLKNPDDLKDLEHWRREAKDSPDWMRVSARTLGFVPAPIISQLRLVEQLLSDAAAEIQDLTFTVASARDVGIPDGWIAALPRDADSEQKRALSIAFSGFDQARRRHKECWHTRDLPTAFTSLVEAAMWVRMLDDQLKDLFQDSYSTLLVSHEDGEAVRGVRWACNRQLHQLPITIEDDPAPFFSSGLGIIHLNSGLRWRSADELPAADPKHAHPTGESLYAKRLAGRSTFKALELCARWFAMVKKDIAGIEASEQLDP